MQPFNIFFYGGGIIFCFFDWDFNAVSTYDVLGVIVANVLIMRPSSSQSSHASSVEASHRYNGI